MSRLCTGAIFWAEPPWRLGTSRKNGYHCAF